MEGRGKSVRIEREVEVQGLSVSVSARRRCLGDRCGLGG